MLAAEIVLKATTNTHDDHAWQRFCLQLSLGESVQKHIAAMYQSLVSIPKTFALALLYHSGYKLDTSQYQEIVDGLLGGASSLDTSAHFKSPEHLKTILAEDQAFETLITFLDTENPLNKNAAQNLLIYHVDKLSPSQYAICWLLDTNDFDLWSIMKLEAALNLFQKNEEFISQAKNEAVALQKYRSEEPIAAIYLRTFSDSAVWKDLLWAIITRGKKYSREIEDALLWLLGKARKNIEIGNIIGKASSEFLSHPSIANQGTSNERNLWLALLAHEFDNLPSESLKPWILNARQVDPTIISALIARLDYIPEKYHYTRGGESYLLPFIKYNQIGLDKLQLDYICEITRDSDSLHPEFARTVERTLLSGSLTNEELEELAITSKFGNLFAVIASYCRHTLTDYDWVVRSIGLLSSKHQQQGYEEITSRAFRIILEDVSRGKSKNEFRKAIEQRITSNGDIDLFEEFLENKGYLSRELLAQLLSAICSSRYNLSYRLTELLAYYFTEALRDEDKDSVLMEIKKAVSSISAAVGEDDTIHREGLRECLLSLAVFYLQNSVDEESERLFLLGIQRIFIQEYYVRVSNFEREKVFRARDTLNAVSPLLFQVSPKLIKQAIEKGANSDVPEVHSLCRILIALSDNSNI